MSIESHEWYDKDINHTVVYEDVVELNFPGADEDQILINRQDAIALAEHFGLIESKPVRDESEVKETINSSVKG